MNLIITTALALVKRGLGATPSNKKSAERASSALLAAIAPAPFRQRAENIFP